jgi:hypothetical protein
MIDFWELAGRLMLMDPVTRQQQIYTTLLPLQADGSILDGHAKTAGLPFPIATFYNRTRDFYTARYSGADKLYAPAISMFALGETGLMFFNQDFRDVFENLSYYLLNKSVAKGRTDKGSDSRFYMVLALLVIDSTTRNIVATNGDFLGLAPPAQADRDALQTLARDPEFVMRANTLCFGVDWTEGSVNTLREQRYGDVPGGPKADIPFRHFRLFKLLQP